MGKCEKRPALLGEVGKGGAGGLLRPPAFILLFFRPWRAARFGGQSAFSKRSSQSPHTAFWGGMGAWMPPPPVKAAHGGEQGATPGDGHAP